MSGNINLSRNTKVYFSTAVLPATGVDKSYFLASNTFEIPVLDGYSFSQSTATQEINLDEAGGTPNRGSRSFNTAINPVDWSMSTYMRPYQFNDGTDDLNSSVEKYLWNAFGGSAAESQGALVSAWNDGDDGASPAEPGEFTLENSNAHQMQSFHLVFEVDTVFYVVKNAAVTSAELDFSIDSIATIAWSGFGQELEEVGTTGTFGATPTPVAAANSFITNKLSTITLVEVGSTGGASPQTFDVPVTGGSMSLENNITYLTPEELGTVNKPLSSYFAGSRAVSGSLNAYLRSGAGADNTGALMKSLTANTETENHYKLVVNIGGTSGNHVVATMPAVQLQIPSVDVADVIGTTISFVAQGSTGTGASTAYDVTANNEVELAYHNY